MDIRDKDKISKDTSSSPSSDVNKSESESSFGQNIGRSEDWESEPSRGSQSDEVSEALGPERELNEDRSIGRSSEEGSTSGPSSWQGDSGRSSGGSSSNLGEQSDVSSSRSGRGGGGWENEH